MDVEFATVPWLIVYFIQKRELKFVRFLSFETIRKEKRLLHSNKHFERASILLSSVVRS